MRRGGKRDGWGEGGGMIVRGAGYKARPQDQRGWNIRDTMWGAEMVYGERIRTMVSVDVYRRVEGVGAF